MFTVALQKEQLGLAHLFTLAAKAKLTWDEPRVDIDSVDVTIRAVDIDGPGMLMKKPALDIQLKSTAHLNLSADDPTAFAYDLSKKNYDDLRERSHIPKILVVYVLPEDETQWVEHSEDILKTRKCAYWCSIRGMLPTENTTQIRIKIPKRNVLSPEALRSILVNIARTMGEVEL